jgi:hypothetical protein
MERSRWEDQNFQLKEVQRLEEEEDISFEATHRLPANVNGLPASFNLSAPKMYLKRIMKHQSFFGMLPNTTV